MKSIMKQGELSYIQSIDIYDIDNSIKILLSKYPVDQTVADKVTTLLKTKDELSITLGCELIKNIHPSLDYYINNNWIDYFFMYQITGMMVQDPSRITNIIPIAI